MHLKAASGKVRLFAGLMVLGAAILGSSMVLRDGGAPMPPPPWAIADGGAPTPPAPWLVADGGAPTPPAPWVVSSSLS